MKENELAFPAGFLWGAATSAHQMEGGNTNDWSRWEATGRVAGGVQSGLAADFWHRFREDFDLLKSLGLNAFRFSIEWSRVEPEEGKFDEAAIATYGEMITELRQRGIEPLITLHHYTNPLWIADRGSWENRQTVDAFVRFAMVIVDRFGAQVQWWMTINEPTLEAPLGYTFGIWPPGRRSQLAGLRALNNMARAHNRLYQSIHQHYQQKGLKRPMVGFAHNMYWADPVSTGIINRLAARIYNYTHNDYFLNKLRDRLDFVGLNYYYYRRVRFRLASPIRMLEELPPATDAPVSDLNWEIHPDGLYQICITLARRKLPILVTENGLADSSDAKRAEFISSHVAALHRAGRDGADIRGYTYWSLVEGFEWENGYNAHFGLATVDAKTQQRTLRPSALIYKQIATANAMPGESQ